MPWFTQGSTPVAPTPAELRVVDPRTAEIRALEARRIQAIDDLSRQYQDSARDPFYALPDPGIQREMESRLVDDVYNRLGTQNAGLWRGGADQAAKALVDYRLGLLREQKTSREGIRNQIATLLGQSGMPLSSSVLPGMPGQPGSRSVADVAGRNVVSNLVGRATGAAGDWMFGAPPTKPAPAAGGFTVAPPPAWEDEAQRYGEGL